MDFGPADVGNGRCEESNHHGWAHSGTAANLRAASPQPRKSSSRVMMIAAAKIEQSRTLKARCRPTPSLARLARQAPAWIGLGNALAPGGGRSRTSEHAAGRARLCRARLRRRRAASRCWKSAVYAAGLYCGADFQAFHADPIVSKQDTHFFNVFSMVIGLLIVIAILIFALARVVASETQDKQVLEESRYLEGVAARLQPAGQEAVAGQDNSALAIKPNAGGGQAGSAAAAPALPKSGEELFQQVCSTCHGAGIAGAPKAGDKAAWGPRIAQGKDVLYEHALKGFQGSSGVMPPKGGRTDLPDDLIKEGVDYMVGQAK